MLITTIYRLVNSNKYGMRKWIDLVENATSEATTDEVYDFVDAYVADIEDRGVANEVYAEHQGPYVHLFVGGYPEDGFSEEVGRDIARDLGDKIRQFGWFIAKCEFKLYDDHFGDSDPEGASSQIMCFIDAFPLYGAPEENVPDEVYHVCRPEDLASIMKDGLEPRRGGNDHIQTENGRVYAITGKSFLWRVEDDLRQHRDWTDLELIAIDAERFPGRWFEDVEMSGASIWTPDHIGPEFLTHLGKLRAHVRY